MTTQQELKELGLTKASEELKAHIKEQSESKTYMQKAHIAYQNYPFVREARITEFNKELRSKTETQFSNDRTKGVTFDKLVLTALESYTKVPPPEVLAALKQAKELKCFDRFEVAHVETITEVHQVPDPILFGRVNRYGDLFKIAEWDTDIKFEDLLDA